MTDQPLSREERVRHVAEAHKFEAEARKLNAEAAAAEAVARVSEIDALKRERTEREELTADKYYHTYYFTSSVSEASVRMCVGALSQWHRLDSDCEMKIVFTSPGGSVIDGMVLFDFIQEMRRAGHYITTDTLGMAASMAGILLQAGDHRIMHREAWVLIHEGSFGAGGTVGQVEDTVEWVKKIQQRIIDIFAERCQATSAPKKLTKAVIKKRWARKDWWLSSAECLDYGLVDEVR